jgi:pimeloyl-ACP methyl ester carboxylesterase
MTKDDMSRTMASKAPSLLWTLTEGRSLLELNSFYALRLLMKRLPKGDGHPVIALPGFVASDRSTQPMRRLLSDLGYSTYGWGLGRNLKFNDQREDEMRKLLKTVHEREGKKVTLIGWSLGGVFAREIAKHNPDAVRSVITLGSPISGDMDQTNARRLYEYMNGAPSKEMKQRLSTLSVAPPVPTTSVYSKTDGIVAWRGSIQAPGGQTENIRVPASHTGLGVNPLVMYVLADRLAQAESDWSPFEAEGLKRFLYRQ